MTAATTFNPLEAARDLEAAGVERKQAEAHAEALRQAAIAHHSRGSSERRARGSVCLVFTVEA